MLLNHAIVNYLNNISYYLLNFDKLVSEIFCLEKFLDALKHIKRNKRVKGYSDKLNIELYAVWLMYEWKKKLIIKFRKLIVF